MLLKDSSDMRMSSQRYGDFAVVRLPREGSVCLFGKIDSRMNRCSIVVNYKEEGQIEARKEKKTNLKTLDPQSFLSRWC